MFGSGRVTGSAPTLGAAYRPCSCWAPYVPARCYRRARQETCSSTVAAHGRLSQPGARCGSVRSKLSLQPSSSSRPIRPSSCRRALPEDPSSAPHHPTTSSSSSHEAGASNPTTSSSSGSSCSSPPGFSREALAAMALSPLAALTVPLATDPTWRDSASSFSDRLRSWLHERTHSDSFHQWQEGLGQGLTYMDWTWHWTGLDLSYVWDPELWVKLQQAVQHGEPNIFWNKLWDRIEYRSKVPTAGLVGDMRLSYAKFLQLLESHRIKRIIMYGDMRTAVVEVPHPWSASISGAPGSYPYYEDESGRPLALLVENPEARDDPSRWFSPEMPEWNMEKYRFYVDLPGDFWEAGTLLRYLRSREVMVQWDEASRQYLLPYSALTKLGEVRTELQIMDPSESWAFLGWLLTDTKLEFYEKAAAVCLFIRGLAIGINLISATSLVKFIRKKTKKKDKKESFWERMTRAPAREFMSKGADGKLRDTGVRFNDIAGMPYLVTEMREVVKMLLLDPAYVRVGAKCPRGIIFQGPPGTGKTYLARAIAGEAGVTFLSAVGSEFVEMFMGVAAARVNSLYHTAREKSPCIIFIDEIDAIGRSRTNLGADPGSQERESALLSMLVQMDGIHGKLEQVLTIGATNLAQELDQALLRPGRFEVVYEIPSPGPQARLEILQYHSRNKPLADPQMFRKVAEATQGWSAAALANLMNEAAILTVRRGVEKISLPMVLEIIESQQHGPAAPPIPASEAKWRLALVTAAKAVALALTPGLEPIKFVTLWSKLSGVGPFVEFIESEDNIDPAWHPEQLEIMDRATHFKVNAAEVGAEPLGEFLHVANLIIPFYAPRALEWTLYGPEGCSLATAQPIADCFELGYYCVRNSMLHPRFKRLPPLHTYIWLGHNQDWQNTRDPLAEGLDEELGYHHLTLTLLKASWQRTLQLVQERRTAIEAVAVAMWEAEDERISGTRLVEIIEETPLDSTDITIESDFLPIVKEVLGRVPPAMRRGVEEVDEADRQQRKKQQQQQQQQEAAGTAAAVAAGAGRAGVAGFSGGSGAVAFWDSSSSSSSSGGGSSSQGGAREEAAAAAGEEAAVPAAELKLDDETLAAVSRAIMGRLDIVDLVGKNTAYDVAERVVDALLDPETVSRLAAMRKYVEEPDAPFPPQPPGQDVPLPVYGLTSMGLEAWKRRNINVITWSALDMLYTERQRKLYGADADMPRYEDTTEGRKAAAAEAAAAAAGAGGGSSSS